MPCGNYIMDHEYHVLLSQSLEVHFEKYTLENSHINI